LSKEARTSANTRSSAGGMGTLSDPRPHPTPRARCAGAWQSLPGPTSRSADRGAWPALPRGDVERILPGEPDVELLGSGQLLITPICQQRLYGPADERDTKDIGDGAQSPDGSGGDALGAYCEQLHEQADD